MFFLIIYFYFAISLLQFFYIVKHLYKKQESIFNTLVKYSIAYSYLPKLKRERINGGGGISILGSNPIFYRIH